MLLKDELFISLADDFAKTVIEFRKAESECERYSPRFMSEKESERYYRERATRIKTLTISKDYIQLTRIEYWQQLIESKIQVISSIGGITFMQDFCTFLYNYPKYQELRLASAFEYYADGIGGWCS